MKKPEPYQCRVWILLGDSLFYHDHTVVSTMFAENGQLVLHSSLPPYENSITYSARHWVKWERFDASATPPGPQLWEDKVRLRMVEGQKW